MVEDGDIREKQTLDRPCGWKKMSYFVRLLKFFLLATIVWVLLFDLWIGIYVGLGKGLFYGLAGGLIVAFLITVIGALYDYLFRRQVFKKYGKRSFEVTQIREIFVSGDIKTIIKISVKALEKIPKMKSVSPKFEANKIVATTGTTLRTFGETIEIEFFEEGERIRVHILSKPRLGTAIFDCGRNIENVEMFSALIKSEMV